MARSSSGGRWSSARKLVLPLVLMAVASASGCKKKEEGSKEVGEAEVKATKAAGTVIKVAGDAWSGYSTFRDEPRLKGELAKDDIAIEYLDDEKLYDQNERMKALASGKIDIALTTLDAFLQHGKANKVAGKYPGVILWNVDESSGGDAIFVTKGKTSFDDVTASDRVCFAAGTPSEHLWDFASLSFSSLEYVRADAGVVASDCWKKLQIGKVQVAVLWQPFTAIAEKAGYNKVFATGGQADDVIIDVLVANRTYVENNKDTVQKLAQAYFNTIGAYSNNETDHAKFITKDCGADCKGDSQLGRAVLDGIDFLDLEENLCLWYGMCGKPSKMAERIGKTGRLLGAKGKASMGDLPKPEEIIDTSFLRVLKEQREEKAKLAAEVAGDKTQIKTTLSAEEVKYVYAAAEAKDKEGTDIGTLKLPNIYFPEGKSELDANAKTMVDTIADQLRSFPATCVRVYGHTNSTGNADANKQLSEARAWSIASYLTSIDGEAFPAARFDVRGFGAEQPIMKDGLEDKDASRRTEFRLFDCGAKQM